jgi:catechol 2,3-dioxygenase-like lactoylglutathione lyase family enzyme
MTIGHISLPVSSLAKSTEFYLALLAPLKYQLFMEVPNGKSVGLAPKYGAPDFWLHCCEEKNQGVEGKKKSVAHVAFAAPSQKAVREFYEAGL